MLQIKKMRKGFLYPDYKSATIPKAKTVIVPIAYERTTSYGKGTIHGPGRVIQSSSFLEMYDEETNSSPCNGLTTIDILRPENRSKKKCLLEIERIIRKLIDMGKHVISVGGEHSISWPLAAAHDSYNDLCVLQLDAHADLRDSYEGSKYSHACVMRRIVEKHKAVQVGIRSISKEEVECLPDINTRIFWAHEIIGKTNWMQEAVSCLSKNVYLTIDVDVFDPSVMPSTGTPEPGGLDWHTVIRFLRLVAGKRNIVGADIVELSPIKGLNAPDFLTAKLVYKIVGLIGI